MKVEEILEKYVVPNDKLISWREIDNEIVFLHKEERVFYELNKTAAFIWKEVLKKKKVGEIIEAIQKRYTKVKREILRKDALNFVNNLLKKKLFLLRK